jgi:hypothetical protein
MHDPCSYDYAIIRVVPRVDRGECINAGIILSCPAKKYLDALIHLNLPRLAVLSGSVDPDVILSHLRIIPRICRGEEDAGPIARLPRAERFDWLTAPRSTIIQTSPVHSGTCTDPEATLHKLLELMVIVPV